MADNNEVKVKLSMDAKGVKQGANTARKSITDFARNAKESVMQHFQGMFNGISTGMMKLVGVAAVVGTAIYKAIQKAFQYMHERMSEFDQIGKQAKSMNLSAEAWQTISYAANHAGADLNKVLNIMGKIDEAVTKGYSGVRKYTEMFERLGYSIEDLNDMTPDARLYHILHALQKNGISEQTKLDLYDLFGVKGMTSVNKLVNSDFLQDAASAKILGFVIPEEEIAAAEAFIDSQTDAAAARKRRLDKFAGIMQLQKAEKEVNKWLEDTVYNNNKDIFEDVPDELKPFFRNLLTEFYDNLMRGINENREYLDYLDRVRANDEKFGGWHSEQEIMYDFALEQARKRFNLKDRHSFIVPVDKPVGNPEEAAAKNFEHELKLLDDEITNINGTSKGTIKTLTDLADAIRRIQKEYGQKLNDEQLLQLTRSLDSARSKAIDEWNLNGQRKANRARKEEFNLKLAEIEGLDDYRAIYEVIKEFEKNGIPFDLQRGSHSFKSYDEFIRNIMTESGKSEFIDEDKRNLENFTKLLEKYKEEKEAINELIKANSENEYFEETAITEHLRERLKELDKLMKDLENYTKEHKFNLEFIGNVSQNLGMKHTLQAKQFTLNLEEQLKNMNISGMYGSSRDIWIENQMKNSGYKEGTEGYNLAKEILGAIYDNTHMVQQQGEKLARTDSFTERGGWRSSARRETTFNEKIAVDVKALTKKMDDLNKHAETQVREAQKLNQELVGI